MRRRELRFAILIAAGTMLLAACDALKISDKPDDKAIVSEVQAKLFQDPILKTRDIRVVSEKGVVVLSGTVGVESEKAVVERLTSQVSGVKQVIDQLAVPGPTAPQYAMAQVPEQRSEAATTAPPARTNTTRPSPGRKRTSSTSNAPLHAENRPAAQPSNPLPDAGSPSERPSAPTHPAESASALPPVLEPERITIPAGTVIAVRMIDGIDSSRNRPGEEFAASLEAPVVVGERVVIPRGSDARVRLVEARQAGHMSGRSELQLELVGVAVGSNTYAVESGIYDRVGAARGTRTAETVGGGAALGALIGAIAGRGKGAAIGAAVGAGAGTAVQAATHGEQVKVPAETKLDFTLRTPLTLTL